MTGPPPSIDPAVLGLSSGAGVAIVVLVMRPDPVGERWMEVLAARGMDPRRVNVRHRPAAVRRAGRGPAAFALRREDGEVLAWFAGEPSHEAVDRLAAIAAGSGS